MIGLYTSPLFNSILPARIGYVIKQRRNLLGLTQAQLAGRTHFSKYMISKYVEDGHQELAQTKLPQLMELRYGGINDAIDKLGDPDKIKHSFEDLQIKIYA